MREKGEAAYPVDNPLFDDKEQQDIQYSILADMPDNPSGRPELDKSDPDRIDLETVKAQYEQYRAEIQQSPDYSPEKEKDLFTQRLEKEIGYIADRYNIDKNIDIESLDPSHPADREIRQVLDLYSWAVIQMGNVTEIAGLEERWDTIPVTDDGLTPRDIKEFNSAIKEATRADREAGQDWGKQPNNYREGYKIADAQTYMTMKKQAVANGEDVDAQKILDATYLQRRIREVEEDPGAQLEDTEIGYVARNCDARRIADSETYCGKMMEYLDSEIARGAETKITLDEKSILTSDIYQALLHNPEMVGKMDYRPNDLDAFSRRVIFRTRPPEPEREAIYIEYIKTLESLGYDIHTEASARLLAVGNQRISELLQKNGVINERDVDRMYDYTLAHVDSILPFNLSAELTPSKDNERAQYWLKYGKAISAALGRRPEKRLVEPQTGGFPYLIMEETKRSDYLDKNGMPTTDIFPLLYDKKSGEISRSCLEFMCDNYDLFKDNIELMHPSDATMKMAAKNLPLEIVSKLPASFYDKMSSGLDHLDLVKALLSRFTPEQQEEIPIQEKIKAAASISMIGTENSKTLAVFLGGLAPAYRKKNLDQNENSKLADRGGRTRNMDLLDAETIRDPMKLGAAYLESKFADFMASDKSSSLKAIEKFYGNLSEEERSKIGCSDKIKALAEIGITFNGILNDAIIKYLMQPTGKQGDGPEVRRIDNITAEELSNKGSIIKGLIEQEYQNTDKSKLFTIFRKIDLETIESLDFDEKMRALAKIARENPKQASLIKDFIFETIQDPNKPESKIKRYDAYGAAEILKVGHVLERLNKSRSVEVIHLVNPIAERILQSDADSESLIDHVEYAFLRNDIPEFVKLYNCSNLLYEGTIDEEKSISPVLMESANRRQLLMADLLKNALRSGNPSLREYLEKMVAFKAQEEEAIENDDVLPGMDKSMEKFRVKFLGYARTLGYESEREILADMDRYREERSRRNAEGVLRGEDGKYYLKDPIAAGDLIKGIDVEHIDTVLRNGYNCPEMIGSVATQDMTHWDADFGSCCDGNDSSISEAIEGSMAKDYGRGFWVCVHNDERFHATAPNNSNGYDNYQQYEMFQKDGEQANFRGIRTGLGSFDVDFYVTDRPNRTDCARLRYEIAKSGCYVPIVNKSNGEVVFTSAQFDELRQRASGIPKYGIVRYNEDGERETDMDTYRFASDLSLPEQFFSEIGFNPNEITDGYDEKANETAAEQRLAMEQIVARIEESNLPDEVKQIFRNINPPNLTDRGTMLHASTGSTGRFTNMPGDGDYDFLWRIDGDILDEYGDDIMSLLDSGDNPLIVYDKTDPDSTRRGLDIRKGLMRIGDHQIEIDITPRQLTNEIEASSDAILSERLVIMEEQDPQKYRQVVTNILAAKAMLKNAKCYKKHSGAAHSQGGLGGIGVEYWVMQHGGSLIEAARAFVAAAEKDSDTPGQPVDFKRFQSQYQVWDYGENYMAKDGDESSSYPYDEFVYRNMDPGGYARMYQACKDLLAANDRES